jgi:hypothetical protein
MGRALSGSDIIQYFMYIYILYQSSMKYHKYYSIMLFLTLSNIYIYDVYIVESNIWLLLRLLLLCIAILD